MSAAAFLPPFGASSRAAPRWAVFLLVAIVLRAFTFGNPIVHVDEEFYVAAAHAMAHGAVPYIDVWDRKPVGLFLLYLLPVSLGLPLGIWAYQALALASVTATAALVARLADRAGWAKGALAAGLAYLLWLDLLEGAGGQTPVFYNLLMAGAASLVAPRGDAAAAPRRRVRSGMAAFVLVGLALQIKYSVLFEGLFFGLWWVWRERTLGRPVWQALALGVPLATVAALPTLAAWGWYAAHGHGDAFVYANFVSIGQRVPDRPLDQLANLGIIVLILSPLCAMAILSARLPRPRSSHGGMQRWLFGWAIVAGLALLLFGTYFDHYALPLLVPLCACAAGFFAGHRAAARVAGPLFALLFAGSEAIVLAKLHGRGTPAQFRSIAGAMADGPPGCLYVYAGTPLFYAASGRCAATRYLFPGHLTRMRENGAIGVDQAAEVTRIMARRPAIVVLGPPFRGERPALRALIVRLIARDYARRADFPLGDVRVAVYARRRTGTPRLASSKSR